MFASVFQYLSTSIFEHCLYVIVRMHVLSLPGVYFQNQSRFFAPQECLQHFSRPLLKRGFSRVVVTGALGILNAGAGLPPVYEARRHKQGHPHLMSLSICHLMPPLYSSLNHHFVKRKLLGCHGLTETQALTRH